MSDHIALAPDYRITEVLGGWALEFREPAMLHWYELAIRPTYQECIAAYEMVCEGQAVNYDDQP